MEEQAIYHVQQSDNVLGVLDQFSTSKEGITLFASKVINEVENGNVDPLKVKLYCKTMEAISEKIDAGTKEHQKTAAAKYGEKPFMFSGAELHLTATATSYDYDVCGDYELSKINTQIKVLTDQKKKREEFLKSLTTTFTIINEETGEMEIISPPNKKQSMGVKVSIK